MNIRQLPAPVDLGALQQRAAKRYRGLLQGGGDAGQLNQFDILFATVGEPVSGAAQGFLPALDEAWAKAAAAQTPCPVDLPFSGGWLLFLAYELAAEIEPVLDLPPAEDGLPTALAWRAPVAVIHERSSGHCWRVAEPGFEALAAEVDGDLAELAQAQPPPYPRLLSLKEEAEQGYLDAVLRARRYIHDGDIFQANLARRWQGQLQSALPAGALLASLRHRNPAPFAGLLQFDDAALISASPERLVRVSHEGRVETRPIAGTRPRGAADAADEALRAELQLHPKERAEHVMLIDLERNDLGRVCQPGTVVVDEMMAVESYATVHHIVSNVSGQLREGVTPGEVIAAVFPGGTITGCPKVRAMQIIAELEGRGRGAYTGALGYLNHDGSMDLNILIRSLVLRGDKIELLAGAGIVADSEAQAELAETRAKAAGMLRAFDHALLD